jgi:hypothetical protein
MGGSPHKGTFYCLAFWHDALFFPSCLSHQSLCVLSWLPHKCSLCALDTILGLTLPSHLGNKSCLTASWAPLFLTLKPIFLDQFLSTIGSVANKHLTEHVNIIISTSPKLGSLSLFPWLLWIALLDPLTQAQKLGANHLYTQQWLKCVFLFPISFKTN